MQAKPDVSIGSCCDFREKGVLIETRFTSVSKSEFCVEYLGSLASLLIRLGYHSVTFLEAEP